MNRIYQRKSLRDRCSGKRPIDKPRRRWIDSVEEDSIRLLREGTGKVYQKTEYSGGPR
jgi:hypothetical protein